MLLYIFVFPKWNKSVTAIKILTLPLCKHISHIYPSCRHIIHFYVHITLKERDFTVICTAVSYLSSRWINTNSSTSHLHQLNLWSAILKYRNSLLQYLPFLTTAAGNAGVLSAVPPACTQPSAWPRLCTHTRVLQIPILVVVHPKESRKKMHFPHLEIWAFGFIISVALILNLQPLKISLNRRSIWFMVMSTDFSPCSAQHWPGY